MFEAVRWTGERRTVYGVRKTDTYKAEFLTYDGFSYVWEESEFYVPVEVWEADHPKKEDEKG